MYDHPVPRGAIRHPQRYRQLMDFSGLQFERKATPMDVDFCLELSGKHLILGEFKKGTAPVPDGQKRAITTTAIAAHRGGLNVLVFIARHDSEANELIAAHECRVSEIFLPPSRCWRPPYGGDRRVRELIDSWLTWSNGGR